MMRAWIAAKSTTVVAIGILLASLALGPVRADDFKQLYDKNCASCHGPTGNGDGIAGKMLQPSPANLGSVLAGKADADIAKVIKEGGKAVGKSPFMPRYQGQLSDQQIQGLVEYVKGFSSK